MHKCGSTCTRSSAGERVQVEPHLCMGCGACATVCPSGALTYAYPRVPDLGARLKTALATFHRAGGRDACVLFYASPAGEEKIAQLARAGNGLPARAIPVAVHHVASVGMDVWLGALAYGASQVAVLLAGDEAPQYRAAIAGQMRIADDIVQALGYQGTHCVLIDASEPSAFERTWTGLQPALAVRAPASFNLTTDKRTTIAMALEHLLEHAPTPQEAIALRAGAPFG